MADIRPFRAFRPRRDLTKTIASLPYDVFSEKEARAYVKEHPGCFLEIDRPETFFPEGHDMYADDVYEKARDELNRRIEDGDFVRDETPSFYIYEQTFRGRTQTGIAGVAAIDDYVSGVIKKHENTREEKEQDRIRHVDICDAQTGPIFLCYKAREDLKNLTGRIKKSRASVSFDAADGSKNRIWVVNDSLDVAQIRASFHNAPSLYIADGHHRSASAVKVGLKRRQMRDAEASAGRPVASDYFLCVLFADDELEILDYNRVVKDLNGLDEKTFLDKISESFDIKLLEGIKADKKKNEALIKPDRKGCFAMCLNGNWYSLRAHYKLMDDDPVEGLDVSILQKYILTPVLGIGDPRTDERIDFVGGVRGMAELERRCKTDAAVAFACFPTSINELLIVADRGLLMPPKSTWFEPKLLSGLFIHTLRD